MRAPHRRVHVLLWALVTVIVLATIAVAWRTRPGAPPPGPGLTTEAPP